MLENPILEIKQHVQKYFEKQGGSEAVENNFENLASSTDAPDVVRRLSLGAFLHAHRYLTVERDILVGKAEKFWRDGDFDAAESIEDHIERRDVTVVDLVLTSRKNLWC
jgi:hypothetical protein